jgi:hypothetical protein
MCATRKKAMACTATQNLHLRVGLTGWSKARFVTSGSMIPLLAEAGFCWHRILMATGWQECFVAS